MEKKMLADMNPDSKEFMKFIDDQRQKDINYLVGIEKIAEDDAADIYQDACLALYNNLKNEKVYKGAALSTYLLQICKNQANHLKQKKTHWEDEKALTNLSEEVETRDFDFSDEKINEILSLIEEDEEKGYISKLLDKVEDVVKHLPAPCDQLLWMRYWDKLSHKEVAAIMKYKSADVSKTKTSRCLNRFKDKIYELLKK